MMKKTVYEAPLTERFQVELEGVFCASANIENPKTEYDRVGEIEKQEINSDFAPTFTEDGWD